MFGERPLTDGFPDIMRLMASASSHFVSGKIVTFLAKPDKNDLTVIRELIATRQVTPVIDRHYRLTELAETLRYLGEGHARGKVVITFEP